MKRVKLIVGILFLILGVAGFIGGTEKKSKNIIQGASGTDAILLDVQVEPPHVYRVSFWIVAEKGESQPGFASATADLQVRLGDETLTSRTLTATASEARGGIKRAANGFETEVTPKAPGTLRVQGALREGDKWTLDIYRDLDTSTNLAPGLFILLAIVGLVLVLRARAS
jgi:hypothetical protein